MPPQRVLAIRGGPFGVAGINILPKYYIYICVCVCVCVCVNILGTGRVEGLVTRTQRQFEAIGNPRPRPMTCFGGESLTPFGPGKPGSLPGRVTNHPTINFHFGLQRSVS